MVTAAAARPRGRVLRQWFSYVVSDVDDESVRERTTVADREAEDAEAGQLTSQITGIVDWCVKFIVVDAP